jgi:hypothetical protein
MSNRSRSKSSSQAKKSSQEGQKTSGKSGDMVCICVPKSMLEMRNEPQCSCGMTGRQEADETSFNDSNSSRMSSTKYANYDNMDDSVYESARNTSILEISDDINNVSTLGMMYRTNSFR